MRVKAGCAAEQRRRHHRSGRRAPDAARAGLDDVCRMIGGGVESISLGSVGVFTGIMLAPSADG